MTARARTLIIICTLSILVLAAAAIDTFWIVPKLQHLRVNIDNDRASKAVIIQQQSNVEQLTKDLASIQTQQVELETQLWTFLKEDTFFSTIENLAKAKNVTIDTPAVADATPTGAILPRAVTVIIHGKLERVVTTVTALQSLKPLFAMQQLSIVPDDEPGDVKVTLTVATLWK